MAHPATVAYDTRKNPVYPRLLWLVFCVMLAYFYMIAMGQFVDKLSLDLPPTVPSSNLIVTLTEIGFATGMARSILIGWTWLVIITGYVSSGFIIWKSPDNIVAVGTAIGLLYVGRIALVYDYTHSPADYIPPVMSAIYITVLLVFPDGRVIPRWIPLIALWGFVAELPLDLYFGDLSGMTEFIRTAYPVPLISVLIYRHRHVLRNGARQQSKWLFILIFVLALGQILFSLPEIIATDDSLLIVHVLRSAGEFLYYLGATATPFAIMSAILSYRLWDVDIFINRTVVYGIVAILLSILIFTLSTGIQISFANTSPIFALAISAALAYGFFKPLRKITQHLVDRHIYHLRFDLDDLEKVKIVAEIPEPGSLVGQTIEGYKILRVLDRGGMGEIYEASGNGKKVAIKTLLPKIALDPVQRTRFEREGEFGLSLTSRYIADVYGHGNHAGTPYIIMEYIEGENLQDILEREGILDLEFIQSIMRNVCEALSIAHRYNIVHRDIKPANIMIREEGSGVLVDFGIGKAKDSKTITGTDAIGTIHYMAPEQILSSKDVERFADIYALGCVLYHLLTGAPPYHGTAVQIMFAQIQQPAPDPRMFIPDIPDHVVDVVMKAMKKNPLNRFTSAEEFVDALIA